MVERKSDNEFNQTPSKLPRLTKTPTSSFQSSQSQHPANSTFPLSQPQSPTKGSRSRPAFDVNARLESMELLYTEMKTQMEGSNFEKSHHKEVQEMMKARITELEALRDHLSEINESLRRELEDCKVKLATFSITMDEARRGHSIEVEEIHRQHRHAVADLESAHGREVEKLRRQAQDLEDQLRRNGQEEIDRLLRTHSEELSSLQRQLNASIEEERVQRVREVQELTIQRDTQLQKVAIDIGQRDREADTLRMQLEQAHVELDREKIMASGLRDKLSDAAANCTTLGSSMAAMKAKIDFLESDNQQQSQSFADLHKRMQEAIEQERIAKEKLRDEESVLRKLRNEVQELKGNIRVFCRVRPTLEGELDQKANIIFPDAEADKKEITVQGPEQVSSLGKVSTTNHAFNFDRSFGPSSQNAEVFEEISQLVQSALDGYNVCIFCYGQTGAGKTFTMSSSDGMIPRAVEQIYTSAQALEEKGWSYTMKGQFVEIYNETINDLLGKAEELDKKKHEIRHDMQRCKTTITDITEVPLDTPETMESLMQRAQKNRSVAATKANERSSRSHCVFILNLVGVNAVTGERSEGVLNLVDLAGSERLALSGAEGQRLKETQSINKSLSCLGDVIAALGQGKEGGHVPYRNSKLSYLLQFSLSGNSKTLMFVMVSPLQAHLQDTLSSLKFAKKVNNTHIGTARRQAKVKD
ncbi:carboxy-terminal kinesin 2 [Rhizodiscina lignyota]|uniref:Kinesin-like protein n=1 Tax=Rhizodiscina lignyota TaxID=1504668 RepID=A0A9P4IFP8_9PEZI|nr:carboxy-terminal kinesin 2 [Rhizodiscina lignyota]